MPASMIVGRGEAKAMATKKKASRAIYYQGIGLPSKQTMHC